MIISDELNTLFAKRRNLENQLFKINEDIDKFLDELVKGNKI